MKNTLPSEPKRKYDINAENFTTYVQLLLDTMSASQRESIPEDIVVKIFKGSKFHAIKLNSMEKIFLLSTVFGKDVLILIGDKSAEDIFVKPETIDVAVKVLKRKAPIVELSEQMQANAYFALAGKDMMETVGYMRLSSILPIWRTTIPAARRTRRKETRFDHHRVAMKAMAKLMMDYSLRLSRMKLDHNFTHAEFYALLYFFHGEGKVSGYKTMFKGLQGVRSAYQFRAITRLTREGYLIRRGVSKGTSYSLSAKGDEALIKIMEKLIAK
jgi:hypothetical protein